MLKPRSLQYYHKNIHFNLVEKVTTKYIYKHRFYNSNYFNKFLNFIKILVNYNLSSDYFSEFLLLFFYFKKLYK